MTQLVNGEARLLTNEITFDLKIGLIRESVRVDLQPTGGRLTNDLLTEIAFSFLDRNFPEHGFYQLQHRILLFHHDVSDNNILRLINGISTTADDIRENSLVEVVLSAETTAEELEVRAHVLSVHSYRSPHFCDFCGEMLFGLVKQGLKCEGCGQNFHKRCAYNIPKNCSNIRKSHRHMMSMDSIVSQQAGALTPVSEGQPALITSQVSIQSSSTASSSCNDVSGLRCKSWCPSAYCGQLLWTERNYAGLMCVPHTFVVHNYTRPTVCQHCKKLLKGLFRQGLQCKDCKFNCHKKCASRVAKDCQGEAKLSRLSSVSDAPDDRDRTSQSSELIEPQATITGPDWDDPDPDRVLTEDEDAEQQVAKPALSSAQSCNIPLQRVVQSIKHTKRSSGSKVIREGWMVHYSNRDSVKRRHYWKLDAKSIILYQNDATSHYFKEILLSDIIRVESHDEHNSSTGSAKTCYKPDEEVKMGNCVFEIHCVNNTVYYVGEDLDSGSSGRGIARPVQSGTGLELAKNWESAIRQARLPLSLSQTETVAADPAVQSQNGNGQVKTQALSAGEALRNKDEDVSHLYQIFPEDVLGSGQFGIVYGARHRQTNREVAIKVIDKLRFPTKQEAQLKNEVSILHEINHPGVVNLEKMLETPEKIFVIMEKLKGDMLEMILSSTRGRLTERIARFIISQILIALKYLHSRHIVHCDLKPENVLLSSETPFPQVKLCDFGFARIIGDQSFRRSLVGTPAYLAPEVLKSRKYNRSLDMWSVGVIVYVSLSGQFPFNEDEEITDQIQNAAFMFPENPWSEISSEAIDLINRLLQIQMRKRFSADRSLAHNWLQDYQCWCDLRKLETQVGVRYLTHESDDSRWHQYRVDHYLPDWPLYGHSDLTDNDRFSFNKVSHLPPSPT